MKRKLSIFFALSLVPVYLLGLVVSQKLTKNYNEYLEKQVSIIQDLVVERFNLYLNTSNVIAVYAAEQFSNKDKIDQTYLHLGTTIIKRFDEILGFNLLDSKGRIIKVFPEPLNKGALKKVSQNYPYFLASTLKKEPYWFSPPFDLFQGEEGFSFYVPFYHKQEIGGWIAPVVSSKVFFEKFNLKNLLKTYHLVIKDQASQRSYFSSASIPDDKEILNIHPFSIFGRTIEFTTWPNEKKFYYNLPWYQCLLLSIILSSFLTYTYSLYLLRQEARKQLTKINALIAFTSQETSMSLASIYNELNLMGKETGYVSTDKMIKYVSYISTLLDQITISKKFFNPLAQPEFNYYSISPLLDEQIELLQNKLSAKGLRIVVDGPSEVEHQVWSNKWLLSHSILGNVLRAIQYYAKPESTIRATFYEEEKSYFLSFNIELDEKNTDELHQEIMDRCLSIAAEVARLSKGEIETYERPQGSKTITIKFEKEK